MSGGCDVEKDHFIRALLVVADREIDRIAHVTQLAGLSFAELNTARHVAIVNIEAGKKTRQQVDMSSVDVDGLTKEIQP